MKKKRKTTNTHGNEGDKECSVKDDKELSVKEELPEAEYGGDDRSRKSSQPSLVDSESEPGNPDERVESGSEPGTPEHIRRARNVANERRGPERDYAAPALPFKARPQLRPPPQEEQSARVDRALGNLPKGESKGKRKEP